MYPQVNQFETRQRELDHELRLIRERDQALAGSAPARARRQAGFHGANSDRGRLASHASPTLELESELTIERTLA